MRDSRTKRVTIAATALILIGVLVPASWASAADEPEADPKEAPIRTQIDLRFEYPISLFDAVLATSRLSTPVLAYRFEDDQIAGEYSPASEKSVKDYLAEFSRMGTQPEVVGFTIAYSDKNEAIEVPSVASFERFEAAPIDPSFFAEKRALMARSTSESSGSAAMMAGDWRPDEVYTWINDIGSRVIFDYGLNWISPTTPGYVPLDYGMEVGIELYNTAPGTRPFCIAGYKDSFFASNHSWNWYAVDENFSFVNAAQPYADYNDATDPCNRNSMSLGLASPQAIPLAYNNAPYDWVLFMQIDAPQGTMTSNTISGSAALVTKSWCTSYPSYSWTDCMGVSANGSPVTDTQRAILAQWRNWTAPNKCWISTNKGLTAPALLIPGSPSGC